MTDTTDTIPEGLADAMRFARDNFQPDPDREPGEPMCFPPTMLFTGADGRKVMAPCLGGGQQTFIHAVKTVTLGFRPRAITVLFEGRVVSQALPGAPLVAPAAPIDVVVIAHIELGKPPLIRSAVVDGDKLGDWAEADDIGGQIVDVVQLALDGVWQGIH